MSGRAFPKGSLEDLIIGQPEKWSAFSFVKELAPLQGSAWNIRVTHENMS